MATSRAVLRRRQFRRDAVTFGAIAALLTWCVAVFVWGGPA